MRMATISAKDATEAATALRAVLAEVEGGEMVCSAAMRHRMEGAALALQQVASAASERPSNARE